MTGQLGYRPEIDGLRAVAVLPVILFHTGVGFLPGGFLGVDVFFVISGYLITLILATELNDGKFSLLHFYERRARRILPALFFVMLVTFPLAWLSMPPDALQIYFRSLTATALFTSNVHFYQSQDYFSPNAEIQPLLHTWSLAVEEQYYLLFPVLMAVLWKVSKHLEAWFFGLVILGFAVCLWQLNFSQSASFYLPHARVWELFAGSTLAILVFKARISATTAAQFRGIFAATSLAVLCGCFIVVDETWATPGFPNLVVVFATVFLLAFADGQNPVGKILASRALVAIGLVSYSAYLWHHPIFAFARLRSTNEPSAGLMLALAMLSMLLAYANWRWVEKPFRKKRSFCAQGCIHQHFGMYFSFRNRRHQRATSWSCDSVLRPTTNCISAAHFK